MAGGHGNGSDPLHVHDCEIEVTIPFPETMTVPPYRERTIEDVVEIFHTACLARSSMLIRLDRVMNRTLAKNSAVASSPVSWFMMRAFPVFRCKRAAIPS
jgi:hypothetical protein